MPRKRTAPKFERKRDNRDSRELGRGGFSALRETNGRSEEAKKVIRNNRRYRVCRLIGLLPGRPIDRVRNVARILGCSPKSVAGWMAPSKDPIGVAKLRLLELEIWRLYGLKLPRDSIIDRGEAYIYSNENRDGFIWASGGDVEQVVDGDVCWDGDWGKRMSDAQLVERPKYLVIRERGGRLGDGSKWNAVEGS